MSVLDKVCIAIYIAVGILAAIGFNWELVCICILMAENTYQDHRLTKLEKQQWNN